MRLVPVFFMTICLFAKFTTVKERYSVSEDNFIRRVSIENDSREFHIHTLNQYIGIMADENSEVLFAEKTKEFLILVLRDSRNRLIANARSIDNTQTVSWIALSGRNFENVHEQTGFSGIELSAKRKADGHIPASTVTISFFEGFVFAFNKKEAIDVIRLKMFVDEKEKRVEKVIDVAWPVGKLEEKMIQNDKNPR